MRRVEIEFRFSWLVCRFRIDWLYCVLKGDVSDGRSCRNNGEVGSAKRGAAATESWQTREWGRAYTLIAILVFILFLLCCAVFYCTSLRRALRSSGPVPMFIPPS